jgi:hypothetical protein
MESPEIPYLQNVYETKVIQGKMKELCHFLPFITFSGL